MTACGVGKARTLKGSAMPRESDEVRERGHQKASEEGFL